MRFTEYHWGVAVIKDKNLLKEAMAKLAAYEDQEDLIRESTKMIGNQNEKNER